MGRRWGRLPTNDDLLRYEVFRDGLHLKGSTWKVIKSEDSNTIACELRLGGYQPATHDYSNPPMPFGGYEACWRLELTRRKEYRNGKRMPLAGFNVSIAYYPDGLMNDPFGPAKVIFRGIAHKWPEAVRETRRYAPVIDAIKTIGRSLYGDRDNWLSLRPFKVQWPWRDVREPNAKYSAFQLTGGFRLDETNDGEALTIWRKSRDDFRTLRAMMQSLGANAFLVQAKDGTYNVFHRDHMSKPDPIDIDDWRARVLAGTDETFDTDD